ncbi:calcium permeable stress-gated cation channel 1-like isoform X2 [Amphibalanus amphitrite]|uniref:calcium permeable stress-gated cation channel 1-like isoform X2 n=1 Tax=Amphibalanus amphitrite TaxID=1232801 RepID=UPI001C90CA26|nr:calcium permeable stress-gated cation channel 1-like isoform X2 [Amphibalanus amphitrite]XP_043231971.1 calcium permeable stress-gated cation channel 1-like isoform X2 [Amphibalanus amphitrite]XP_043231972.1 calcium permeable stress-gated cation channel 1-like isoform X2 [Amphibalanus amphitrite]XP_043231974.1 calcium permeable stress-gated cation channel 1-like isoform X2 [Amphibalanus amphitrite]
MATVPPPTTPAGLDPFVVWDGNGTEPPPDYPSDDPNENITCNQYIKHNTTFIIYGGYEGVPLNLGANVVLWLALIFLFSLLRKSAWNYGRLALVHKNERRWTQLFYGNEETMGRLRMRDQESFQNMEHSILVDRGLFSWIVAIFKIGDDDILRKCGTDAVQYLSFQRHIMVYLTIVTVAAIGIVLPVNFQGELEGKGKDFGHTTISNLDPSSSWLWLHVSLSVLFLPLGVYIMRRFSSQLHLSGEDGSPVSRTIMITNVPRAACNRNSLLKHFQEAYPSIGLQDIQFSYNISRLMELDRERDAMFQARLYADEYLANTGERLAIRPYICGNICCCCARCGCVEEVPMRPERAARYLPHSPDPGDVGAAPGPAPDPPDSRTPLLNGLRPPEDPSYPAVLPGSLESGLEVDAIQHYSREESRLSRQVEIEKAAALNQPLGIAFITFRSREMAARVLNEHALLMGCRCRQNPPSSSLSSVLKPHRWQVQVAPPPEDIYWQNLSHSSLWWYVRSFFVNLVLFLVLFFLTTPVIVVNSIDVVSLTDRVKATSRLVSEFLPTLLLWTIAALMPVLVAFTDRFLFHWTRSSENYSVMVKTFIFLLFMVLILPSLGLTSARAFVEWAVQTKDQTYRWSCIFLPDNGAFFVNYVITSAFIGTGLEIIRFPELFVYAFRMCMARSQAEIASVRAAVLWEFPFGIQYAWMLLIFAMTTVYSLLCPLITPFGLIYMVLKHLVDKHNIYFAYGASRIKKRIHVTAINFVILSIVLTQLCLCFFAYIRRGLRDIAIYSLVGLSGTLLLLMSHVLFHWFQLCSPIRYETIDSSQLEDAAGGGASSGDESPPQQPFVPSVLQRAPQVRVRDTGDVYSYPTAAAETETVRRRSYGSNQEPASNGSTPPTGAGAGDEEHQLYQNYNQEGAGEQLPMAERSAGGDQQV